MMDMEVDLFNNVVSEEDTFDVPVEADNNNFDDEGERCGICMDIVVDRGVLDCCQHWFCFVCIDNWATITNLCPLCQNEFQLITCIPVFDTIGSSKADEESDSRDDDWCIEEKNNTLSFPSYYIDENAVTCLDGGGCKIRSGSLAPEDASTLDTSIACDSCDIWYHASCVGFDPEGSEVDTWLCPRCHVNGAEQKSEFNTEGQLSLSIGDHHSMVHTCSGKVSVSIADDGETALVISRIDEDVAKGSIANCVPTQEVTNYRGIGQSMCTLDSCSSELNKPLDQGIKAIQPQPTIVSVKLEEYDVECGPNEGGSNISPDLKLSSVSTSSNKSLLHASEGYPSADENLADRKTNLASKAVKKRKQAENSVQMNHEDGHHDVELVSGSSTRKLKSRKGIRRTLNDQADVRTPDTVNINKGSVDDKGGIKKSRSVDIMSIVKGTDSIANGSMNQKEAGKGAKVQKNAARLRVKKIMRRPNDNKESAEVVQKLKREIREAVSKKSSDTGKSIVDPELLAAFRAAVAEPAQKPSPVNVKAKKLMFQKGKAREHLTKKIYAMSNGKRKRAWDRDCEVEFWKHRCLKTSKPEKIATLKSVLNLLQRSPETRIVDQNSKEDDRAPILSRLYLADASVFPRKDDIKPLSVLKASTSSLKNGMLSSAEKNTKSCLDNCSVKFPNANEIHAESNASADDKNKTGSTCINNGVAVRKLNTGGQSEKSSCLKKITAKSEGVPIDKRKWALEILARKTASNSTSPTQQKQDDALSNGNYPLLAELPTDMRPKLAPIRHNKITSSVRQAQLYRLTEHFLKMANLPSIRRSAATELAVADAVNIEKQVADRSVSKVVYLNLCSQEIRRHTNSCTPAVFTPSSPPPVPTEGEQSSTLPLGSETEAALRAAGLLSDSPPSSPLQKAKDLNGCDSPVADVEEEEMENILEMDSHPDLDIYGDFEYDLDEEDYIGATGIASSKPQAEEEESKVKVVFSTLTLSKPENASEGKEQDLLNSTGLRGCLNDADSESLRMEGKKESVPLPGNTPIDGEREELSLAECEQLYGPDKEPVIRELPILVSTENSTSQSTNNLDIKNPDKNHNNVVVGRQSPGSAQAVENTQEEKNSDLKVDKKADLKVDKKSHRDSVLKKVEAYVKEHIRPLCKSGVITVDQYRWAVGKTTDKVMKYHTKAKNANFLIKDGDKVKKLAEQYIEAAAKHKEK